jgi:hypothetical protein
MVAITKHIYFYETYTQLAKSYIYKTVPGSLNKKGGRWFYISFTFCHSVFWVR